MKKEERGRPSRAAHGQELGNRQKNVSSSVRNQKSVWERSQTEKREVNLAGAKGDQGKKKKLGGKGKSYTKNSGACVKTRGEKVSNTSVGIQPGGEETMGEVNISG